MLKIGDKVRMNDKYHVSAEKREKVWTVVRGGTKSKPEKVYNRNGLAPKE